MPQKSNVKTEKTIKNPTGSFVCGVRGPGPKYLLKTLVGYKGHCFSKHRNPAYSFGIKHASLDKCSGPGPKYLLDRPIRGGFSFGLARKSKDTTCTPGPKYFLPHPTSLAFTIKSRTKHRQICGAPGPYNVKHPRQGPAFFIGQRTGGVRCDVTPGPRPYSVDMIKPRAPKYSLAYRTHLKELCRSPGPKYLLTPPKSTPQYYFGVEHSECAPPYIDACDEDC